MITNRRGALFAVFSAAFGGATYCFARIRGQGVAHAGSLSFAMQVMDTPADRLSKDLDRLKGRVYSEEGIPMILACENLVPGQAAETPFVPTALNKNLAAAFRRDTEVWQRLKPDAAASDVPKIIEMLADRDFSAGGSEKTL